MKRFVWAALAGLSAAACVVLIAATIVSHWYDGEIYWASTDTRYEFYFSQGKIGGIRFKPWERSCRLIIEWGEVEDREVSAKILRNWPPLGIGWHPNHYFRRLGVMYATGIYVPPFSWQLPRAQFWRGEISSWYFVLLTAILPAMWVRGFIKRRRRIGGLFCTKCGYDFRETKERCPECGTAAALSIQETCPHGP